MKLRHRKYEITADMANDPATPARSITIETISLEYGIKSTSIRYEMTDNNPEATAEVLHGGWFRTGDLAQRKENGAYRITGRTKSMIVAENGKKIFPEELELHLANIEGVSDCLVFRDGEGHITASVLPDDELLAREDAAQYLCAQIAKINEGFPRYKRMDTLVIRRDPFDKTTTQKIKRNSPENLGTEGGIRI